MLFHSFTKIFSFHTKNVINNKQNVKINAKNKIIIIINVAHTNIQLSVYVLHCLRGAYVWVNINIWLCVYVIPTKKGLQDLSFKIHKQIFYDVLDQFTDFHSFVFWLGEVSLKWYINKNALRGFLSVRFKVWFVCWVFICFIWIYLWIFFYKNFLFTRK